MQKINIANLILNELDKLDGNNDIKAYITFHNNLCNDVLYSDPKYKDTSILLTSLLRTLTIDFSKEVHDCVNHEGAYNND